MAVPQELTPFGHALAGALGGCFSNAVVYPLDTAKTRLQATPSSRNKKAERSIFKLLVQILREEGPGGYYRGFFASMVNTFSQQYAYFFFYSLVRNSYIKRTNTRKLSTAAELILGALAGALAQIFTIPVSVIATRQQVARTSSSFLEVGRAIVKEDGPTGLWLGLKPGLVLTANPAITYGAYERLKTLLLQPGQKLPPLGAFALGAASKTLATIVTYPYIMAKIRVQARAQAEGEDDKLPQTLAGKKQHPGALRILARVWQEEGPLGWYQGMGAQITKAVLSQALLFVSKEQFERYALLLMIIAARARNTAKVVPV